VAGFFAILLALYSYFGAVQINQLNVETDLAARGVETAGEDYLSSLILKNPATRITLIDQDGTVLYDNKADPATMENHSDRPEFQEAIQSGVGDSTRFSNTLTTEMLYSAKQLSDGKVLRIAENRNTVLTIAMGMVAPMLWIFVLLLIVNWVSAMHVSKRIIEPLNNIDLDHPIDNDIYPEVSPLLRRIHQQQEEIAKQQEELARTEKEITTVTNHMEEGLMMISEAGRVLSINTKAQKLLHTDADCLGSDILTLERRIEFQEALDAATE
jgi:two-component system phosphate regulon sensor histidine kinase PhoR